MRKILMSWLTAPAEDPFAGLEIARAAGYAGLGLRLCDPATGLAATDFTSDRPARRRFRQRLDDSGLLVAEIEARVLSRGTGPQIAPDVLETAAELGNPLVIAVADQAGRITLPELHDRFAALAEEAAVFGLSVGFEPIAHRACGTWLDAHEIVSGVANAALVLDALHLHRMGVSPSDLAAVDPTLLRVFHICDAPEIPDDLDGHIAHSASDRLLPGEGILPLGDYLAALPSGLPLSLEIPMQRYEMTMTLAERAERSIAAARRIMV